MPDLIFSNVNVLTMDPVRPWASLVAVKGDRIAAVSDNRMIGQLRGPGTRIVDCSGATLIPGFVDAHCHVYAYAESLVSLNLSPREHIRSITDIQDKIADFCKSRPPGTWVRGKGYNEFYLAEGRHPDCRDLDAAAPLHPVKLTHRSGHAHALNSLALQLAGITAETGDPPEGFIDREPATGEPTGVLYGMGEYLSRKIPPVEEGEIEKGIALANAKLLACGVTSVQDASSVNDRDRWRRCESWKMRQIFHPRISMMIGVKEFLKSDRLSSSIESRNLRLAGVKIMLGRVSGELHPCQEELNEIVAAIHAAGMQAAIHAIEEPEIESACEAIAYAVQSCPGQDRRHRIEHCSVCPPLLLRKIAGLGIAVVTQPSFIYFSGDRYLKTVAEDKRAHLYAIGSMLRQGLRVGFGSDFPIADPDPMTGIQAAVTRITEEGRSVVPGETISVPDALMAYTCGAAAANFEDGIKGSITEGKLADMVLLSEDPRAVDPGHIKDIRAIMTVLGGRIAWNDSPFRIEPPDATERSECKDSGLKD
jgi:predicted amidohydrolase YtcJ